MSDSIVPARKASPPSLTDQTVFIRRIRSSSVRWGGRILAIPVASGLAATLLFALCGCSSGGSKTTPHVTPVSVSVTGNAETRLGGTTQFTATVTGTSSSAVAWQVNGVAGGSAATGTISTTGLYIAPSTLPTPNTVTIDAVSSLGSTPGTLTETLLNPLPIVTSATATQSGTSST